MDDVKPEPIVMWAVSRLYPVCPKCGMSMASGEPEWQWDCLAHPVHCRECDFDLLAFFSTPQMKTRLNVAPDDGGGS